MAQAPNSAANPASQAKHGEGAVMVTSRTISCDGGGGALGHPLVYLPFDGRTWVDCYYCGQRFAKSGYETPDAPTHTAA